MVERTTRRWWRVIGFTAQPSAIIVFLLIGNAFAAAGLLGRLWLESPEARSTMVEGVVAGSGVAPKGRLSLVTFVRPGEFIEPAQICGAVAAAQAVWYMVSDGTFQVRQCDGATVAPVTHRQGLLVDTFGVRAEWGRWFVYGTAGDLQASGDMIQGGIEGAIRESAAGRTPGVIPASELALFAVGLGKVTVEPEVLRSRTVLFVAFANTGCGVAPRIRAYAATDPSGTLVVPRSFPPEADERLRSAFDIGLAVVRASEAVQREWDGLIAKYGLDAANGLIGVWEADGTPRALGNDASAFAELTRLMEVE